VIELASDVQLPAPRHDGEVSLEQALSRRQSVRQFAHGALTLAEVGQVLWAAQGITHSPGLKAAPSAGALHLLEVHLAAGEVSSLAPGLYHYNPSRHALAKTGADDRRAELAAAAFGQGWIADAPAALVLAAVYRRPTGKYGARRERYVHIEIGQAAQNVYLQAVVLGLGTTEVGAFDDSGNGSIRARSSGSTGGGALDHPRRRAGIRRPVPVRGGGALQSGPRRGGRVPGKVGPPDDRAPGLARNRTGSVMGALFRGLIRLHGRSCARTSSWR
jgi:SagB-type dehydrogenase family enzyme